MAEQKRAVPRSYTEGKLEKHNFKNKTPEERHAIAMKGVEARRKKREENMLLQRLAQQLILTKANTSKSKRILEQFGFKGEDAINGAMMVVALYKKVLTGDVSAFREFGNMMEKLEMAESGKKVSGQNIVINLVQTGETHVQTEEEEMDIWKAENGILETDMDGEEWNTDGTDTDDWGDDVYDG